MSVQEALRSAARAKTVTPPTPATGSTVPPIGECDCVAGRHDGHCAHRTDGVNLEQHGAAHPGVTVHMDAYLCDCKLFSSPSIVDIQAHQAEAGCLK